VGGVQAVGEAGGGGAVQEIRGGSESMRWAERTKVTRKNGGSQISRKEKTVRVVHSPYHASHRTIWGSKENTCCMQ
jgi:hypothetical protein